MNSNNKVGWNPFVPIGFLVSYLYLTYARYNLNTSFENNAVISTKDIFNTSAWYCGLFIGFVLSSLLLNYPFDRVIRKFNVNILNANSAGEFQVEIKKVERSIISLVLVSILAGCLLGFLALNIVTKNHQTITSKEYEIKEAVGEYINENILHKLCC